MSYTNTIKMLELSGILDSTRLTEVREQVRSLQIGRGETLLVDLAQVNFMDSSGLSALIVALKQVRSLGGELCICAPSPQVQVVFDLTSMDQVFRILRDRAQAVMQLQYTI